LDQQLLLRVLSAAAHTAAPATATQSSNALTCTPQELQQLQQHLDDLAPDACLLLLEELLPLFRPSNSSAGSSGEQSTSAAGHLSEAALGLLLRHALLPKLQSLSAAASKSMLDCLVVLGDYLEEGRGVLSMHTCLQERRVGTAYQHNRSNTCIQGEVLCSSSMLAAAVCWQQGLTSTSGYACSRSMLCSMS
jgi:hypothetical protein